MKNGRLSTLGGSAKRGPNKSPDYIAQNSLGRVSVVECKGTQSSRQGLEKAIQRGRPQKANLEAIGGTTIEHSLVAGIFVPQFESKEDPVLMVADPEWRDIKDKLARFSTDKVSRGISQVAYAKEMAMLDLSETANALSRAKSSADDITVAFNKDLDYKENKFGRLDNEIRNRKEYFWPHPIKIDENTQITGVRFDGILPEIEINNLKTMVSPEEHGELKREKSKSGKWAVDIKNELSVSLNSPLGSIFLEGYSR